MTENNDLTDREIGRFEERLSSARHKLANHQMVLDALVDAQTELRDDCRAKQQAVKEEVAEVRQGLDKLKTRIAAGAAVLTAVFALVAWIVEVYLNATRGS